MIESFVLAAAAAFVAAVEFGVGHPVIFWGGSACLSLACLFGVIYLSIFIIKRGRK